MVATAASGATSRLSTAGPPRDAVGVPLPHVEERGKTSPPEEPQTDAQETPRGGMWVEEEFEPSTLQAFRRLALDGASGAMVADELGLSVAAVYMAKSRVLQRIRQEVEGLID